MRKLCRSRRAACATPAGLAGRRFGALFVAVSFRMPAAPLEGKAGAGNQFCHVSAAFWAFVYRIIGKFAAQFEAVAAGVALVFIDRHW